jgi:hypothetical protein
VAPDMQQWTLPFSLDTLWMANDFFSSSPVADSMAAAANTDRAAPLFKNVK